MQHDDSDPKPEERPQDPQPAREAEPASGASGREPPIEVEAEPASSPAHGERVYDAPPHTDPPPNPFSAPAFERVAPELPPRGWAVATHLIGLLDLGFSILAVGLIATTALWLFRRGDDAEADYHGKESLNLQLNILFWQIVACPLILCCLVGLPILLMSALVKIAILLWGGYQASQGERVRYPYIFRIVS